ncbi:MAG TPA: ATP-binding protein [Polyangiales bacterium]|nr:ATP-binding protein [Polyangiales bacterium]
MNPAGVKKLSEVLQGTSVYERLEELIPGMIYVYDLVERRNVFTNRSLAELLGYSSEEVAGLGDQLLSEILHPDDLERALEHHAHMRLVRPGQVVEFEYRVRDSDDAWRWLHSWEIVLEQDATGASQQLLGIAQDVTHRVEVEGDLRESQRRHAEAEQRWRSIAENPYDFVVVIDRDAKYTYVNFGAPGVQVEELIGKKGPHDFVAPRDQAAMSAAFEYSFTTGKATSYEVYVEPLDKWYHNLVGPIREGDQVTHLSVLTRDISSEKRAQAQAREAEQQVRRMEGKLAQTAKLEAVGQLAGGIAHDFNNLLTGISGVVELLAEQLEQHESLPDVLELREAVQRGAALTRQLLAFSRQQSVAPTLLSLNELVETTSRMLRRLIAADIDLVLELGDAVLCVRADSNQLEQVVMNLAVNARDAMPDGGVLKFELARVALDERARVEHPDARRGAYARLSVSDTGHGMDEATLARIFEPFFTTKPMGVGTGLGLSMVHGIVSKAGGFVEVRSRPGEGSTFEVWLPLASGQPVASQPPPETRPSGTETVLLVEDEAHVLRHTTQLLQRLGYRVIGTARADEALALVQSGTKFDLLLTDVLLPGIHGHDLFRRLTALRGDLPVVFMSGYTSDVLAEKGIADAGALFLAKPFSWNELALKVRAAIDTHRKPPTRRVLD